MVSGTHFGCTGQSSVWGCCDTLLLELTKRGCKPPNILELSGPATLSHPFFATLAGSAPVRREEATHRSAIPTSHEDDNFASGVLLNEKSKSLARLAHRVGSVDDRLHLPGFDEILDIE